MMPPVHTVTLRFEENIFTLEKIECVAGFGALCRQGCGVLGCEWSHPSEGCNHCEEICGCYCEPDADDECVCPIKAEHDGACPHVYRDLGECWLLPWVHEDDGSWFDELPEFALIREAVGIRMEGEEQDWGHPVEMWTLTFMDYEGEPEMSWWPTKPDLSTLRRAA